MMDHTRWLLDMKTLRRLKIELDDMLRWKEIHLGFAKIL